MTCDWTVENPSSSSPHPAPLPYRGEGNLLEAAFQLDERRASLPQGALRLDVLRRLRGIDLPRSLEKPPRRAGERRRDGEGGQGLGGPRRIARNQARQELDR